MPSRYRDNKHFVPGQSYHVFNRSSGEQVIFRDQQDYRNYLKRLKLILGVGEVNELKSTLRVKPFPKGSFSLIVYCLMPTHYHFLIKQNTQLPISSLIQKLCTSYSAYFNKKYKRNGHVFGGKFKAKPVETDPYFMHVSSYIHRNPKNYQNYPYSSYLDFVGERQGALCGKEQLLALFDYSPKKYQQFVANFDKEKSEYSKEFVF